MSAPHPTTLGTLLDVSGLTKRYGQTAVLTGVAFTVEPNTILGVIGPNGAGKTTLMECVAGLLPADSCCIAWQGEQLPRRRRKEVMFYLPDGILPFADQAVGRTLAFYREMFGVAPSRLADITDRLLLGPATKKQARTLSKGYRRRLLLAIGLLSPQPLLILDEPFDGFDLRQTLTVMELLREVRQDRTLMLSVHQLTDAQRICDRFLLLAEGRVLGHDTLDGLCEAANAASGSRCASLEEVFLALT